MKEEFLHFIWKNLLFVQESFTTARGDKIVVINPGTYNRDSGPDFFNSRIMIGETEWAGNVEIHINSSDWDKHGHNNDPAYDNVILHLVKTIDATVYNSSGEELETVEIRWDRDIYNKYLDFLQAPNTIACFDEIKSIPSLLIRQSIEREATSRLSKKIDKIRPILNELNHDWEETLYRLMSKYLGLNVNSDPFYMLSCRAPLRLLRKHADDLIQVEALLYGQAGMLEQGLFKNVSNDNYYNLLLREYSMLKSKYSLVPMDGWIWKFHRMRPANFPTLRISQMASLIASNDHLFASLKDADSLLKMREIFNTSSSSYWHNHYQFGRETRTGSKRVKSGNVAFNMIVINCAIPMIFLYGKETGNREYCNRAIRLSDSMPPEKNRITREWKEAGIIPVSSFETQGLIELRETKCKNRDCLNCHIGTKLISLGKDANARRRLVLEEPGT